MKGFTKTKVALAVASVIYAKLITNSYKIVEEPRKDGYEPI